MVRVIRMALEYDGTRYHGFGLQPGLLTIQGEVERALRAILGAAVRVTPAGRTDAGVHARGQVISFATDSSLPAEAIGRAANAHLPDDIAAGATSDAGPGFDARRSARQRRYRYAIWNRDRRDIWGRRYSLHLPGRLDEAALQQAADALLGRHDFSSFIGRLAEEPHPPSPLRTISLARWSRDGDSLYFDCAADAFARHMVRSIVGTLLRVGRGRMSVADFRAALAARDRRAGGPTAPSRGLTLMDVTYDDRGSHS